MNEKIESTVTVNIGGVYYSTSRSTLCADKNSMLTAVFWPPQSRDTEGWILFH